MSDKHFAHALLSESDIETINAARRVVVASIEILSNSGNTPSDASLTDIFHAGRVAESADQAKDALFNFLNCARCYLDLDITEETLIKYGKRLEGE